jgi:hypothetical protein
MEQTNIRLRNWFSQGIQGIFSPSMETKISLPYSEEHVTLPNTDPDDCYPDHLHTTSIICTFIWTCHLRPDLTCCFWISVLETKILCLSLNFPKPATFCPLIPLPYQHSTRNKNYRAPHCKVFSSLCWILLTLSEFSSQPVSGLYSSLRKAAKFTGLYEITGKM